MISWHGFEKSHIVVFSTLNNCQLSTVNYFGLLPRTFPVATSLLPRILNVPTTYPERTFRLTCRYLASYLPLTIPLLAPILPLSCPYLDAIFNFLYLFFLMTVLGLIVMHSNPEYHSLIRISHSLYVSSPKRIRQNSIRGTLL